MGDVVRLTNLTTGGPVHVDVKDGKILRIVPLQLDDTDAPSWTIRARGRDFTPPRRTTLAPYIVSNRSHVYSPKRILTPLKRVDFDPAEAPGSTGPGGRNIQNRGTSGYEPISWDEALDTVAEEIVRCHRDLGPATMLTSPGSHHLWALGPQYIPSWEGHHTKELTDKYPLQLVSPHPRFSLHTMSDSKDSWTNDIKDHRVLVDGHHYWILRLNTADAVARSIKEGELIRAFNDRGDVIVAAQVTERVPPGTAHCYESVSDYLPLGEPGYSPDTAGCINILTPKRFMTPTSTGMAPNSCLIQVEKWTGSVAS